MNKAKNDLITSIYVARSMIFSNNLDNIANIKEHYKLYGEKFATHDLNITAEKLLYEMSLTNELEIIENDWVTGVDPYCVLAKMARYASEEQAICILSFDKNKTFCIGGEEKFESYYIIDTSSCKHSVMKSPKNLFHDNEIRFKAVYIREYKRNRKKIEDNKKKKFY